MIATILQTTSLDNWGRSSRSCWRTWSACSKMTSRGKGTARSTRRYSARSSRRVNPITAACVRCRMHMHASQERQTFLELLHSSGEVSVPDAMQSYVLRPERDHLSPANGPRQRDVGRAQGQVLTVLHFPPAMVAVLECFLIHTGTDAVTTSLLICPSIPPPCSPCSSDTKEPEYCEQLSPALFESTMHTLLRVLRNSQGSCDAREQRGVAAYARGLQLLLSGYGKDIHEVCQERWGLFVLLL